MLKLVYDISSCFVQLSFVDMYVFANFGKILNCANSLEAFDWVPLVPINSSRVIFISKPIVHGHFLPLFLYFRLFNTDLIQFIVYKIS